MRSSGYSTTTIVPRTKKMGKNFLMKEHFDPPRPDDSREEWHRKFRAMHEAGMRDRARAVDADRRWRAAVTAELNRRRGLLGWLGLR